MQEMESKKETQNEMYKEGDKSLCTEVKTIMIDKKSSTSPQGTTIFFHKKYLIFFEHIYT